MDAALDRYFDECSPCLKSLEIANIQGRVDALLLHFTFK